MYESKVIFLLKNLHLKNWTKKINNRIDLTDDFVLNTLQNL